MKKIIIIPFILLFIGLVKCYAQIDSVLISDVKFKNSKFDNSHAGSGFLLKYKNKIYAITAKHVLSFAKTDSMKSISFGDDLKSWSFSSKTKENIKVMTSKLINEDPNEPIIMPPKGDWLMFEIKGSVPKGIAIYSLRDNSLKNNEGVYFLGYPYNSTSPIKVHGKFIGLTKDNNLRLDVPKGTYNGCSGGPVLDSEGKLVGLVSMGYFNKKEDKMIFEPASLEYFLQVINK